MKNKAFTLAEVLIVISIIGVLATVMLSAISKMAPDKEKMRFKKAYSTIERTVGELVNDEDLYPYDPNKIGFKNTDTVTWPGSTSESFTGNSKFRNLFLRKLNIIENYSLNGIKFYVASDGIAYSIPDFSKNNDSMTITVDINGKEDPNSNANASNRDIYSVIVDYDGRVTVTGSKEKEYLKSSTATKD